MTLNTKFFVALFLIFFLSLNSLFAQSNRNPVSFDMSGMKEKIDSLLKGKRATVGVTVTDLRSNSDKNKRWTFIYSDTERDDEVKFATMSTYKFHLALALLEQVDKGKVDLYEPFFLTHHDLLENTYSPLRKNLEKKYGQNYYHQSREGVWVRLNELLSYMVSRSDNNACDVLFRFLGGKAYTNGQHLKSKPLKKPYSSSDWVIDRKRYNQLGVEKLYKFVRKIGLKNTQVAASEEKMHETFYSQYLNYTTPEDAVLLLSKFYGGEVLKPRTQLFLWNLMLQTETGQNKIQAGLPNERNILLGHKTGSSFRAEPKEGEKNGLKVAENDIGIVVTPKSEYAIAVYIKNSLENNDVNAKMMAEISRLIFEKLGGK